MKKINLACVIDDDPIYIFGIQRVIKAANFCDHLLIFHNGKEAFDSLKNSYEVGTELPDVILLDINMPVWDGWQFLDEFIKTPIKDKNITIYITSSSIDPTDMSKAKAYREVRNFIIKPVTVQALEQIMAS